MSQFVPIPGTIHFEQTMDVEIDSNHQECRYTSLMSIPVVMRRRISGSARDLIGLLHLAIQTDVYGGLVTGTAGRLIPDSIRMFRPNPQSQSLIDTEEFPDARPDD